LSTKHVYKGTNKINGKVYIGQTRRGIEVRIKDHRSAANREYEQRYELYREMREFGFESFEWEIIDIAESIEELKDKEEYWIKKYRDDDIQLYNISAGRGAKGFKMDRVHVEKMRQKRLGIPLGIGEDHPTSKLKDKDLREIETLIKNGEKVPNIAKMLCVSESSIYQIISNATWKHDDRNMFSIEVMKKNTRYFKHKHEYEIFLNHKGEVVSDNYKYKFIKIVIQDDSLKSKVAIKLHSEEWKTKRELEIGTRMDLPKRVVVDFLREHFKEDGVKPNYFKVFK
jgi:group I intron endonuclease